MLVRAISLGGGSTEWNKLTPFTGTATKTINANEFNELLVVATRGTGTFYFSIPVVKDMLQSTEWYFRTGYYVSNSNYATFDFQALMSSGVATLKTFSVFYNGTDVTSNSTFTIYYR